MVDQSLQQPIDPPSIKVEGGTPELRDRYQRAFAALPDNARTVIARSQPTFVIGQGLGNYLTDKKIVLPSNLTGPAEPILLSLGLAHALPLKFDERTLRQAVAGIVRENLPPAARHMKAEEFETKVDQLIAGMKNDGDLRLIGIILGAGFPKFPPGSPINKADPFYQTPAGQIYSAYMDALQEQGEKQHAQAEAGFPKIMGGSAADHKKFKEIFATFSEMERKAILSKGIKFTIADDDVVTHAEEDGSVIVNRQGLYNYVNPQYKHLVLQAALFSLAAPKLGDVDWEKFIESFQEDMTRIAGRRLDRTSPYDHQSIMGLIETLGGNAAGAKLYYQTVYARYKQAIQDTIAEEKATWYPQVATDDAKYGHVSDDEIAQFKKLYRESWPQETKNLIEANDLTFVLGRFAKKPQPLDPDSKIVKFDCDLLNTKYMVSTAIYNALLTACADKMQDVNWAIIASELRGIVAAEMPPEWKNDPATLLSSAKHEMNKIGESAFRAQYRQTYAALQPIWQAMDQASGKNGEGKSIAAQELNDEPLPLLYKNADTAPDDTPFTLRGSRVATHSALVLTPQGLVPIANAIKAPPNSTMNLRYAMAIFEPEHCQSEGDFIKRLEEERQRFKANKIVLKDEADPSRIIDTDKYFEQFSNGAIQLYAMAAEYNTTLPRFSQVPIDEERLKENILRHGQVQPVFIKKTSETQYSTLWGLHLYDALKEIGKEKINTINANGALPSKRPAPVDQDKIRHFEEEYGKWSNNLRTAAEHAGLIYLLDGNDVFFKDPGRSTQISADSKLIGINVKDDREISSAISNVVREHARLAGLINHDIDTVSLWARSRQELEEKGKAVKDWVGYEGSGVNKQPSSLATICNIREDNPDEYRKRLGFTYIADQRSNQLIDEVAETIRTGKKLLRADLHATAFAINSERLTETQQQYFNHLNKILSLIGATPKEFDNAFRFAVKHHQLALMGAGEPTLERELGDLYTSQNFTRFKTVDRFEGADFKFNRKATKKRASQSEFSTDIQKVQKSSGDYSAALDNCFGYINCSLPSNPIAIEQAVIAQPLLSPLPPDKRRRVEPLFLSAEENVLQLYAQGINDLGVLRSISQHGKIAHVEYDDPSLDRIFTASIYNAAVGLVRRKGLSGEVDQAVKHELAEMDKLTPQLFLTKGELEAQHAAEIERQAKEEARKAKETAAAATLVQKQAAEAERRRRAAEEETKNPKPYSSGLSGSDAPIAQEVHAFCQILDCRIPSHQRLGDTLLSPEIFQVITSHIAGQPGQVKALLNSGKHPEVAEALRDAQTAIEALFKLTPEQIPAEQQEITERIKQSLLQSPIFLSFILGKQKLIDEAQQCRFEAGELGEDGAAYIKEHVHNMLSQHWPALAAIVIPAVADKSIEPVLISPPPPGDTPVVPPPAAEKELPASIIPLVPVVAAAGAVALTEIPAPVTPPAPPEQEIKPSVKEPLPDTPPVDAGKVDVPPPPIVTETVAIPLATVLKDDPGLPPAELDRRRAQAYQAMAKQLAMDAENAGLRALEDGYDQFRCDLLLDKTHARIRLLFQSENASKPPREEIFDLNSNQYIGGYARLGVVPTTLDALNLRIIVNGEIAGDGDFLPILSKTSGGKPRIGKNDFIPNRAIHPEERKTRVTLANNGMYQLELTSRFTKNGDDVTITFPLGIKEDRTDETKDAEARAIADARGKIVTDFIDNYNDKATKRRKIPVKGDIQEHLETEVRDIRNANTTDPRGQWAYPDRIELLVSDGLQHHYLKLVDPLYEVSVKTAKHDEIAKKERREARDAIPRVVVYDEEWKESLAKAGEHQYREVKIPLPTLDEHPAQDQQQVTTLGAIALNKKGSNRTYHLDFNLHVNDGTVKTKRREHTAGYNIRGRSLNLCIEDPEIARSRAQEVLFGNKNMLGFVDMVSDYFHQRPQARWALEAVRNGDDEITKKQLAANLEKEARTILGDDPVRAYRQIVKNELPITTLKRRLNVVRNEPQHGVVIIRARIEERQPDKSYALAKGADNRDLEIIFSVPEKQADVVERFARGDMDGVRLDVLINDQIPRFEHDLSVKIDQGEVKGGKIPVTFSVMRGRRDGKLEQHLDRHGKPARMRLLVPEQQGAFISSADPEKDALAETVDKHVGLLSAIHYSPITPVRPFGDTLRYQELQAQYDQVKKDRDGFIDQTHPDFNPDKPKGWLEHAVTSNMRYHLPDISDVQVLREVRNGNGGGNGHGKPNGIRERFPSELQALREDSLCPQEAPFMERIDKEPRTGFGRRV